MFDEKCECDRDHDHDHDGRHETIENTAFLEVEVCGKKKTIPSNTVKAHKVDLEITKTQDCALVFRGEKIKYTVLLKNKSHAEVNDVVFKDRIPHGTEYVEGSLKVIGEPATSWINGKEIIVKIEKFGAHKEIRIEFEVKVL